MTDEQQTDRRNPFDGDEEAEMARASLEAATALEAEPGPERFFGKKHGLLADVLREAIVADLRLARGPGGELYIYDGGVWKRGGDDAVKAKVVELLGDRNRVTHANLMTENIAVTTPYKISGQPEPRYINFKNGMLDWKTGELHLHNPELMSVNQLPYDWNPNATCPRTDKFMREVFPADAIALAYELIGYAMYDGNPLQKAALLLGSGANGKSVYLGLVHDVLGEENVSSVTLQSLTNERFAAADLYGRLANIAGDLPSIRIEDTSRFKMITGGDTMRAERKFRDAFSFKARAFPLFSANELPGAADTSPGYMRRWIPVSFPRTFLPEEQDARLSEILAAERSGVAVKAVAALRRVMERGGFTEAASVTAAHNEMAISLNPIKEFFHDRIKIKAECITSRRVIYQEYLSWCAATGRDHPLVERRFWSKFRTEMMSKSGMTEWDKALDVRNSSGRYISGVRIANHVGPAGVTS